MRPVGPPRAAPRCTRGPPSSRDLRPYLGRARDRRLPPHVKEAARLAKPGDRIVVHGHRSGEPDRDCEVLEVHGDEGAPPYLVRWGDSGHETLFFPGPDAAVAAPPRTR